MLVSFCLRLYVIKKKEHFGLAVEVVTLIVIIRKQDVRNQLLGTWVIGRKEQLHGVGDGTFELCPWKYELRHFHVGVWGLTAGNTDNLCTHLPKIEHVMKGCAIRVGIGQHINMLGCINGLAVLLGEFVLNATHAVANETCAGFVCDSLRLLVALIEGVIAKLIVRVITGIELFECRVDFLHIEW